MARKESNQPKQTKNYVRNIVMDVITFPENLQTTSGYRFYLRDVM